MTAEQLFTKRIRPIVRKSGTFTNTLTVMDKTKSIEAWIDVGYLLFATEGMDGLQVERLSRMVQRNKSCFYHYFGDLEVFCSKLLLQHEIWGRRFLDELRDVKNIEPDYFNLVLRFKLPVLFQMKLYESGSPDFRKVAERIDAAESEILQPVWTSYINFDGNERLAENYFNIVRDRAYMRLNAKNFTYDVLSDLFRSGKVLMDKIIESKLVIEKDEVLR